MMMINIFGVISECVIITYFLCKYFGFRYHDYAIVKSSLFFIIITIYDYASGKYIPSEFVAFWGFFLLTFLFSFIFLKGNVLEKIATCALTFILIASINLPILAISSAITNQYPDAILNSNGKTDVLILDTFFSKIIYFGVLQAILLFRRKEKIVLKAKEWIVIIASFIISILIASLVRLLLITHSTQPFFYFFIALCLTALDLIILLFIIWVNRSISIREENLQIRLRLEKQEKETKLINEKYEEISMLRHDFSNLIFKCALLLLFAVQHCFQIFWFLWLVKIKKRSSSRSTACSTFSKLSYRFQDDFITIAHITHPLRKISTICIIAIKTNVSAITQAHSTFK